MHITIINLSISPLWTDTAINLIFWNVYISHFPSLLMLIHSTHLKVFWCFLLEFPNIFFSAEWRQSRLKCAKKRDKFQPFITPQKCPWLHNCRRISSSKLRLNYDIISAKLNEWSRISDTTKSSVAFSL